MRKRKSGRRDDRRSGQAASRAVARRPDWADAPSERSEAEWVDELKRDAAEINNRGNELGFGLATGRDCLRESKVLLDTDSSANPYVNLTYLRFQYNARMACGC